MQKNWCMIACASQAQTRKSLTIRVHGPLWAPGSSRVFDALSCPLSLILKHSYNYKIGCNKTWLIGGMRLLHPHLDPPQGRRSIFRIGGGAKSKKNFTFFGALCAQELQYIKFENCVCSVVFLCKI